MKKLYMVLLVLIAIPFFNIKKVKAASKEYTLPFSEPNTDYLVINGNIYLFYAQPYGDYIYLEESSVSTIGHSSSTYYYVNIDSTGNVTLRNNQSSTLNRNISLHYAYWNGSKWIYNVTASTSVTLTTGITTTSYIYANCPIQSSINTNNANVKFNSQPSAQIDYNNTLNSILTNIDLINQNISNLNDTTESLKTTIKTWLVGGNSTSSLATIIRNQFSDLTTDINTNNTNLINAIESALTSLGLDLEANANTNRQLINNNIDEFENAMNIKLNDVKNSIINQLVTLQQILHADNEKIDNDMVDNFEIAQYYMKNQSDHVFNLANNSNVLDISHKFNVESGSGGLRFYPTSTPQQISNKRKVYLTLTTKKNIISSTKDITVNVYYINNSSKSISAKLQYNSVGRIVCVFEDNTDDIIRYVNIVLSADDIVSTTDNEYINSSIIFIYPNVNYSDSHNDSVVDNLNNKTDDFNYTSGQYESMEHTSINSMNEKLSQINTNIPLLNVGTFNNTMTWVRGQLQHIFEYTQLSYMVVYSLVIGLALYVIGIKTKR